MKYDIYKTKYQTVISNKKVAKILKKHFGSLPSFNDFIIKDTELAVELNDTLGVNTNAEELFWYNNDKKLVFANNNVIQMLNRANFSSNLNSKILPPVGFETFALCFEKDSFVDVKGTKVRLYPCQITVMTEDDMFNRIHKPFDDLTGYSIQRNPDLNITITVSYKIKDVTYRSCVDVSEILNKLDADGVRASESLSDVYDQRLDEHEQLTTNTLMKIAIQLLIFNAATENKYLISGFPAECKFRMPDKLTRTYWNASHFKYESTASVSSHIRSSHFRCLTHDKYYQNDHESTPKGSRWILIRESFIGSNQTFTQNTDK